ncbi:uncharacterized protein A4U43_C01F21730 [Asparagus officinalis]|uniref:Uncharacterized protein n=1 Tax=Asparagus officinalis TaxID=4686 RepID=A0A5P1FTN4_ASPOF|nr:uncharacterized protein A4U43_C01F21730 [Asparagus officinalis]
MKRVKDLAFSELTLLAEDVDHDVEGVDGGSDPGAEHLGVDDPGLVELLELDEGGEQAGFEEVVIGGREIGGREFEGGGDEEEYIMPTLNFLD